MSPTYDTWLKFRAWVKVAVNTNLDPAVEGTIPGEWYHQFKADGRESSMWEIWLLRFMHDNGMYTLYPWIEDGSKTLVYNWRERGLHFDGVTESFRDYPLVTALPPEILNQAFVPYVDWGLQFYYCLTGHLYGATSNQILTFAWGQQKAKGERKFLRLASLNTPIPERLHLTQNWDSLFDNFAFPFMKRDGLDDERCAKRVTYESTYSDMLNVRADGLTLPLPRSELMDRVADQPQPTVSVHGRTLENQCSQYSFICAHGTNESNVEDLCNFSKSRVQQLFQIEDSVSITLFTDGQDKAMDSTYNLVDSRPLFDQIWAMVNSPRHIGNPRSSLDFLVFLWRRQRGILIGMEPVACYH